MRGQNRYTTYNNLQWDYDKNGIFEKGRSRADSVSLLRRFIYKRLQHRWETIPKDAASFEKKFVSELLTSLI